MAAIDKIYGTNSQRLELLVWLEEHLPEALTFLYEWGQERRDDRLGTHPISNFPTEIDFILWRFCPLGWVRKALQEQYGCDGPRMPLNTAPSPDPTSTPTYEQSVWEYAVARRDYIERYWMIQFQDQSGRRIDNCTILDLLRELAQSGWGLQQIRADDGPIYFMRECRTS
jgi:hypothetical protein